MFGTRLVLPRKGRDEGERPFWISYADLMTALMMLFLVVMAVSLFAITSRGDRHEKEINLCMEEFQSKAKAFPGVLVDVAARRVDFGTLALFANNDYHLPHGSQILLRGFAPVVLDFANAGCGRNLLKRVVVEGYTSNVGSYLFNLDLSLKRAHYVMCSLLDTTQPNALLPLQQEQVRNLFLVGGYSFNSNLNNPVLSRRVELKLEFWGLDEKKPIPNRPEPGIPPPAPGLCQLK